MAQTFNTIARQYSGDSKVSLTFDFAPLEPNPIVSTAQNPTPPIQSLTFFTILQTSFLAFAYYDFGRLVRMREKGILRQYILVGAPESSFILINALLVSLSIMLTTAVMCGFYSIDAIKVHFQGTFVVMLLSSIAIPLHFAYWHLTSQGKSANEIIGAIRGLTSLYFLMFGVTATFLAFSGQWIPAIIIETIFCTNPFFATGMLWIKYIYSYNWWLAYASWGLEWYSFNRSLPAIIGMSFQIIYNTLMILVKVKLNSTGRGHDGVINRISDNRTKFPAITDFDLHPESTEFVMDELVQKE